MMASEEHHRLLDLLWRNHYGDLEMSAVTVLAGRPDPAEPVHPFATRFIHTPAPKEIRAEADRRRLNLLRGNVDRITLSHVVRWRCADRGIRCDNQTLVL